MPYILHLTDSCLFSCMAWKFSRWFNLAAGFRILYRTRVGVLCRILNRPHFHLPSVMVHKYCLPVNRILQFIQSIQRPIPANALRLNTMNNRRGEKGVFCRFPLDFCVQWHTYISTLPPQHPIHSPSLYQLLHMPSLLMINPLRCCILVV